MSVEWKTCCATRRHILCDNYIMEILLNLWYILITIVNIVISGSITQIKNEESLLLSMCLFIGLYLLSAGADTSKTIFY